jgi:Tol biopolymer transport system component/DNA-binding winged helix-turn-helix (wHTH) protein
LANRPVPAVDLDLLRYELRVDGRSVRLERQPMELLVMLAVRRGELVTRDEIAEQLWGKAVFLDAQQGINNAICKIRLVLHDASEHPRFVETVIGKGYRLIGPMQIIPRSKSPLAEMITVPVAPASAPSTAPSKSSKLRSLAFALPLLMTLVAAGGIGLRELLRPVPGLPFNIQQMRIRKVTQHGHVGYAGISPDGRYIAYVKFGGNRSLWVQQVTTGSEVQVVPPQSGLYLDSIFFSPDGNSLYFGHTAKDNDSVFDLNVVPTLGGPVRRVLSDVVGAAISPDGVKIAFVRWDAPKGRTLLMVANSDGSEIKEIAARGSNEPFLRETPAWSPDGKLLAAVVSQPGNEAVREIVVVPADGGTPRSLAAKRAFGQFGWLNNDGLLAVAFDFTAGFAPGSDRAQIYYQPYPAGDAVRFSNDMNHYTTVSLAAGADALLSIQEDPSRTVSIAPARTPNDLHAITHEKIAALSLDWVGNNRLVLLDENLHLVAVDADGSNRTLLSGQFAVHEMQHCGDHAVVFARVDANDAVSLWVLDLKGGALRKLVRGSLNMGGSCSPDGNWAYYTSYDVAPARLMKILVSGGQPVPIGPPASSLPLVSPDGAMLLCQTTEGEGSGRRDFFAVVRLSDGTIVQRRPEPPGWDHDTHWAPDGKGFIYQRKIGERRILWLQPLGATEPHQITEYSVSGDDLPWQFAYSPDGKLLAVLHGAQNRDAVLFTNFRR